MKLLQLLIALVVICSSTNIHAAEIPEENINPKALGTKVAPTDLLQSLSRAILESNVVVAEKAFFPRSEFMVLKKLPKPGDYYDQNLMPEFRKTFLKRKKVLDGLDPMKGFTVELKWGYCKWKAINSEYNHIAYWSCYRNEVAITQGSIRRSYGIRTLINWGRAWYVTHL